MSLENGQPTACHSSGVMMTNTPTAQEIASAVVDEMEKTMSEVLLAAVTTNCDRR